jgi:hypothetical protein
MCTLGEFPNYNLLNENCETVASWIVSNVYSQEHHCLLPSTILGHFRGTGTRFNLEAVKSRKKQTRSNRTHKRTTTRKSK